METARLKHGSSEMRRSAALHMRSLNMTYKEIGWALGEVSPTRAKQIVMQAMRHTMAGYRYQYKPITLSKIEVEKLLPLIEFLKGVAGEY